jgi:general secretion pathway protein J
VNRRAEVNAGFTLLEVLVSISIFAIIGLGANQLLRSVIDTQSRVRLSSEEFRDVSRAFNVIGRDLSQMLQRGVRDEYGEPLPPLMVSTGPYLVEFTRAGWNNPIHAPRSEIQRVAYHVEDEVLYRMFWLVLDRAEDSEPISQKLLSDVIDFRVSVMDREGESADSWPAFDSTELLPPGVELVLETASMGAIRRVYALTDLPTVVVRPGGDRPRDGDSAEDTDAVDDGQNDINTDEVDDNQ